MRRREQAGAAERLHAAIEGLARDYSADLDPKAMMDRWQETILALSNFMLEAGPDTSAQAIRLIQSLGAFLEDVRAGRPSAVLAKFKRGPGQQASTVASYDLAMCCVAMTYAMRAGKSKTEAARWVAQRMRTASLPFPPTRNMEAADWQTLDNWRDKLIAAEKGDELVRLYDGFAELFPDLSAAEWLREAENILESLAAKIPKSTR